MACGFGWHFGAVGAEVGSRWRTTRRPARGGGSSQNPTLEGSGDDLIRLASCLRHGAADPTAAHPATVPPHTPNETLLGAFGCPLGALWVPFGCLWVSLGALWVPFGCPWGALGCLLGSFGGPWGPQGGLSGANTATMHVWWAPKGHASKRE